MEDPLIYHYYKLSDHRNPEDSYWIMKKRTENDKTFLITQVFERNKEGYLVIVEVRKELIDYAGVHLNGISGNYEDQKENMQWATSQIEQSDLYSWTMYSGKKLELSYFIRASDSSVYYIQRNKTYDGLHKFLYEGDKIAACFITHTLAAKRTANGDIEYTESAGKEFYIEGIGLVDKEENDGIVLMLDKPIPAVEWKKIYKHPKTALMDLPVLSPIKS